MSTESLAIERTNESGEAFATRIKANTAHTQGMHLDPEVMGDILTTGSTNATAVDQEEAVGVAGRLFRAEVVLTDPAPAGNRWLMVVNKASAAINGDLAVIRGPKLAGDFASIDLGVYGVLFSVGIQLVLSTSPADVQLSGIGDGFFQWAVV